MLLVYGLIYPIAGLSLLAVLVGLTWRRVPSSWLWILTACGVLASVVRLIFLAGPARDTWGIDHRIFWNVGADVWAGVDPYTPDRYAANPFLNPPSTFPFFALLAALPFPTSLLVSGLINTVLAYGVVWLAEDALDAPDEVGQRVLSRAELGALATAFALSDACMATLQLGQLALMATALILLAMIARSRHHPVAAGVALGLSTMKIGTMVPFLLLFHRKGDRKTWITLGMTVIVLVLLAGHPMRVLDQAQAMLHHVGELSKTGAVNDISYAGPYNEWILGLDHLAYRLGIRDAAILKLVQPVGLLVIGVWLAMDLVGRRIPYGLGLSLVSLYSVIFLYHRLYDAVMIVPALVYAAGQAKVTSGRRRFLYAMAVVLMFLVLYLRRRTLSHLTDWVVAHRGPAATLIEWVILPHGTWAILLAMGCLRLAAPGSVDRLDDPEAVSASELEGPAGVDERA